MPQIATRIATKMKLHKSFTEEYKKRHNPIWPELAQLLKTYGISDYSIFLDEETDILFAILTAEDPRKLDSLKTEEIMRKWWTYMKDLMQTNEDHSPVSTPLVEMFYLP